MRRVIDHHLSTFLPLNLFLAGNSFQDKFACFRVYSVEEDDEFGNSWKLLAR